MKVLQFVLSLLIIINFYKISLADDNLDSILMKRPFCNAFTGCGRKRDPGYSGPGGNDYQLPMPVYRALLRADGRQPGPLEALLMRRRPDGLLQDQLIPPPRVGLPF